MARAQLTAAGLGGAVGELSMGVSVLQGMDAAALFVGVEWLAGDC